MPTRPGRDAGPIDRSPRSGPSTPVSPQARDEVDLGRPARTGSRQPGHPRRQGLQEPRELRFLSPTLGCPHLLLRGSHHS